MGISISPATSRSITINKQIFPRVFSHNKQSNMSLKFRCSRCSRGTSSKNRSCSDCRASSGQTTVYVVESGARIEVTTDSPSRPSSSRHRGYSSSSRDAAYYGHPPAEPYRDAGRRDARHDHGAQSATYCRGRVHPYSDRYEYTSADRQPVYAAYDGAYMSGAQRGRASSSHAGYRQSHSEGYYPQPHAQTQQARGQGSQVQYVYSGTEGPDGEIID